MAPNLWTGPEQAVLMMLAGWIQCEPEAACQKEEIRALREMLGQRRLRFSHAQRRRMALLGHEIGRTTVQRIPR